MGGKELAHELLEERQQSLISDRTAMDAFSPEFAQHWLAGQVCATDDRAFARCDEDELSPAQQVALEELAERVNAARSVY